MKSFIGKLLFAAIVIIMTWGFSSDENPLSTQEVFLASMIGFLVYDSNKRIKQN